MKSRLPTRLYWKHIKKDLERKMVFLGGPRQVGKTTLAQTFIENYVDGSQAYLNWDLPEDRKKLQSMMWSKTEPLVVIDEIHKRKGWQQFIKGIYDRWKNTQKFVVTGSARLDLYRKGGDSMLGRYHYYRVHPYTLPELGLSDQNCRLLFQYGGFPEPLTLKDETETRRWHLQRLSKLVRIDLRDLENVSDLDKVEMLAESLQCRVGSLLSYRSLSEDLECSDKTVKRWTQILENLYFCYLIFPFGSNRIKAIKKTPKIYLWDWSQIESPGAKFENMVASHLLKLCHFNEDINGYKCELRFIHDDKLKECDFVFIKDKKPVFAVECKMSDTHVDSSLRFLKSKLPNIPRWYQVHMGTTPAKEVSENLWVTNFHDFCKMEDLI
jgi:predicted AAA+ superfamily ATPase